MKSVIKVSKLEAARRQIDVAIHLYFNDHDPLAVHTLACAAHEILRNIGEARGIRSMKDLVIEMVVPSYKKEAILKLDTARNFLKHADRDPEAFLEYNVDAAELWLFDCCMLYQSITGEKTNLMATVTAWICINHPDLIADPETKAKIKAADFGTEKRTFLKEFLNTLNHLH